ncbi:uncharacterized protein BDZ99DRAFT_459521 [Mytilinidion resinicola]|uniref:Uncharacterized protein n=1 Tax=Mytilinidion resinicola TaxID=574789 RepID=A0A6A6Z0S7_9PEZI|nr:uncharacterized protein BDZ99DRAFT_459521 [Mytilinidion resinicola]KAF2813765.1 hypothetical protein BDZ99DRAFT_459521 [Mytilinidion resinicola]
MGHFQSTPTNPWPPSAGHPQASSFRGLFSPTTSLEVRSAQNQTLYWGSKLLTVLALSGIVKVGIVPITKFGLIATKIYLIQRRRAGRYIPDFWVFAWLIDGEGRNGDDEVKRDDVKDDGKEEKGDVSDGETYGKGVGDTVVLVG